ncbi:NUDIX domain-containing protein [Halobellus sp. EA9]|uniref:NUDIX domain-containing protein n=1 Tax=Halobellus sp. EA9 TaxID=3421647 RepID=UPI003EBE9889
MDVHDQFVPDDDFRAFLEAMPQVCVEVVLETDDGVLLAERNHEPRVWFWPGSRLYKGEELTAAARRVGREELGIEIDVGERLGVHAHFWDADRTPEGVSRHTVNIVYRASPAAPDAEIDLDDQHSDYRFVSRPDPDFHEYVWEYFAAYDLP